MNIKLMLQLTTCIFVVLTFIIFPLLCKIRFLKKSIKDRESVDTEQLCLQVGNVEKMKAWEQELYGLIGKMVGDLSFNKNIYVGAFIAHQRGFQMSGLEQWLCNPSMDRIYNNLIEILITSFPRHQELYGFNVLDNIARILCASEYKTKKIHNIICNDLAEQDIRTVLEEIRKQNLTQDLHNVFRYLKKRVEDTKNDDYYRCQDIIKAVSEEYEIPLLLTNTSPSNYDVYEQFDHSNQILVDIVVNLLEQNKISVRTKKRE